jgi:YbbR domain-containing protein
VVRLTPSIITLNIERTLQRTLSIRPRFLGAPAEGYEIAGFSCSPREVLVAGPASRVREVASAFTEPVSVEGARTTLVERVNIGLEDPVLRIQGSPRVRVTARIREASEKRTFESLPVAIRGAPATVTPQRVTVVLTGPASIIARVSAEDVQAYVEIGEAQPEGAVPVAVAVASELPGVRVHQTDPVEVTVRPKRRR